MDRLVAARIASVEKFGRDIKKSADFLRIAFANGGGDGFPLSGSAMQSVYLRFEEFFHLVIAAIARDIEESVVNGEAERIRAVVEQVGGDLDLVLANREIDRRAI